MRKGFQILKFRFSEPNRRDRPGRRSLNLVAQSDPYSQLSHLDTVNRHLRVAVDQVGEGIAILEATVAGGAGPRIVFANRGLCRLSGWSAEQLYGQPLARLFDRGRLAEVLGLLPRVAEAGRAAVTRATLVTVSGTERPCRWTINLVRDAAGRPLNYMVTVVDESPPEASEEPAVADAAAAAAAEEAALDQLARLENLEVIASGIAHDFRNHLTAVMLNISNSGAQAAGSPMQREFLERATASARQAKELADQLMEFSRGGNPVREPANVGKLLRDCASLTLSGSTSCCHLEVAPDLWPACVDGIRIKQVINNLFINASQAMPNGGHIFASAVNEVLAEDNAHDLPPGPYTVLRVVDRGVGIGEAALPNIFKRNFTTKKNGNGLGLASSFQIVRSHEGTMTVRSKENIGSEFSVYLPASPDVVLKPEPVAPAAEPAAAPASGSVLIVDDQHVVRAAVKASVEALGYEADEATSGEEAIAAYRRRRDEGRPYQMVLMDRTLPGGHSGDDAMRLIRQMDPRARVIAASGAIESDADADFRRLGYITTLPKPFDLQKLSAKLSEAAVAELPA